MPMPDALDSVVNFVRLLQCEIRIMVLAAFKVHL
jgi:hypothetical protein